MFSFWSPHRKRQLATLAEGWTPKRSKSPGPASNHWKTSTELPDWMQLAVATTPKLCLIIIIITSISIVPYSWSCHAHPKNQCIWDKRRRHRLGPGDKGQSMDSCHSKRRPAHKKGNQIHISKKHDHTRHMLHGMLDTSFAWSFVYTRIRFTVQF